MYTIKIFREGQWVAWASAANPKVINQYLDLLRVLHPRVPVVVDTP